MKFVIFSIVIVLLSLASVQGLNKKEDCKCKFNASKRIINGNAINSQKYAWLVNIRSNLNKNHPNLTVCQGTLLNEDGWILTAASCIPEDKRHMLVELKGNRSTYEVAEVRVHENYERDVFTADNDIALIRLSLRGVKEIKFDNYTKPGCLDNRAVQINPKEPLFFAGYGSSTPITVNNKTFIMKNFRVPVNLTEGELFDRTSMSENCMKEKKKMMCVNNVERKPNGICMGDQGSPIHKTKMGKYLVVAVAGLPGYKQMTNGTIELCSNQVPARVVRVNAYLEWIRKQIGNRYCES